MPGDPPPYEQLINDLGSGDAAIRKTAAEKLATAEAIPFLLQAAGGTDEVVARGAVEILVGLLDSDQPEVADQADAAVADLEKVPRADVARQLRSMLEQRERKAVQALQDLGLFAGRQREGLTIL